MIPPTCRRHASTRRGFTLIELMVVIAIIVLAAGLMTPTITDFFKNRKLERIRGELGAAFNTARLRAVNQGTKTSLVFFREGVRIYDEYQKRWIDDLWNPDNTPLAEGQAWFILGFLDGKPSTQLKPYREWKRVYMPSRPARGTGQTPSADPEVITVGLPKIIFNRDGSITFGSGADVPSHLFNVEGIPPKADIMIYQANNTTACFIDLRGPGQLRYRIEPTGEIPLRPPTPEEMAGGTMTAVE